MVKKILLIFLGVVFYLGIAEAADSFSIPVSCSIPAVPGLNVPLSENTQTQAPAIAEEKEEDLLLAEHESISSDIQTQTLYTR